MNLHTFTIRTMAQDRIDEHHYQIVSQLEGILNTIDALFENPIFIDNIEGEQELRLDAFSEMLEAMVVQFSPSPKAAPFIPRLQDDSFDAD